MTDQEWIRHKWIFEQSSLRQDTANKRLFIINIILIAIIIITNGLWLYRESQFQTEITTTSIEAEQDADNYGSNYIITGDYNAEAESKGYDNHEEENKKDWRK